MLSAATISRDDQWVLRENGRRLHLLVLADTRGWAREQESGRRDTNGCTMVVQSPFLNLPSDFDLLPSMDLGPIVTDGGPWKGMKDTQGCDEDE